MSTTSIRSTYIAVSMLGCLLMANSCIDEAFDLRNLDDTISFKIPSLEAPFMDRHVISVSDLMDIEDNDYIREYDNGDYYIFYDAGTYSSKYSVNTFKVTPTVESTTIRSIPTGTYDTEVIMSHGFRIRSSEVPKEVKEVGTIDLDGTLHARFGYRSSTNIRKVYLMKGSAIQFPDWIVIGDYDKNVLTLQNGNMFLITNDIPVSENGIVIDVNIVGVDMQKYGYRSIPAGGIDIRGEFETTCHYVLRDSDIKDKKASTDYTVTFECDFENVKVKGGLMKIDPGISLDSDIYELDNISEILDIDGQYELDNVNLIAEITNDSPISAEFAVSLCSLSNNVKKSASISGMVLEANTSETFCINDKKARNASGITDLFNSRPDKIWIDNSSIKGSDEFSYIEMDKDYTIGANYRLEAPIAFRRGLDIVTEKTVELDIDFGEIEIESLEFSFTAENSIPLGMTVSSVLTEEYSKEYFSTDAKIAPGVVGSPSSTPVKITMTPEEGKRVHDVRLLFKVFNDDDHAGININRNQKLVLNNIKLKVNGISIE